MNGPSVRPLVVVITLLGSVLLSAQQPTTGFAEDFALAQDRAAEIVKLIPGTPDWYYYRCLEREQAGDLDAIPAILAAWVERHGRDERVAVIENRLALLHFSARPDFTWRYLQKTLSLDFAARQELPGARSELPTVLDQDLIARARLAQRALELHPRSLDGFHGGYLPRLLTADIEIGLLRQLLDRLDRSDLPGVVELVLRELDDPKSRGFGSLRLHGQLLLDQLDTLAARRPELLRVESFIGAYLARLAPGADEDATSDPVVREAWFDRLETFTRGLGATQNSLKAQVLNGRLRHEFEQGRFDKARFLDYIRLPRRGSYVNADYLRRVRNIAELVDVSRSFVPELPQVGDDEALVRAGFERIFATEDTVEPYAPFIDKRWLERCLAETRILAGTGDVERWNSLLDDPGYFENLRERVEIDFAPTSKRFYAPADPVRLEVAVKNVATLLVKIYEIDALSFYAANGREIGADLEVEGLMPTGEKTLEFADGPFVRRLRQIDLPELDRPGTWIVELIGNGLSSRAVIRKGNLDHHVRSSAAGQVFRVFDEAGRLQRDARLLLEGREYLADADGEILISYSTRPQRKNVVLRAGERVALGSFEHLAESYRLSAAAHVDREALVADGRARIVVRPQLRLCGDPIPLELLDGRVITITARDGKGIESVLEIRDPELVDGRDWVHEIEVPANLRGITVALKGKVRSLSQGRDLDLAARPSSFALNLIADGDRFLQPLLGRNETGWVVDLLGRNGERYAGRPVAVTLRHEDFRDPLVVPLQSDAEGRIGLGPLVGIDSIRVEVAGCETATWNLFERMRRQPRVVHALVGDTIRLPQDGSAQTTTRSEFSLIEFRADQPVRDCFEHVRLVDGQYQITGLAGGDYRFESVVGDSTTFIKVTAGRAQADLLFGRHRVLEASGRAALDLAELKIDGDTLVLRLRNQAADSRVHVVASRYLPPYDLGHDLGGDPLNGPGRIDLIEPESDYQSGRRVADEYRYILERRFAARFPGNMLDRPGLLLNPWAVQSTATAIGLGGGAGGDYGGRRGGRARRAAGGGAAPSASESNPGILADLDFLPLGARLITNLVPDETGLIRLPLSELGEGQMIQVLALDQRDLVYRTLIRPETRLVARDRRLRQPIDPALDIVQSQRIEFLDAGASTRFEDRTTARIKVYDDLASVYRFFLGRDRSQLGDFAFILDWPGLDRERKNELYSEHACHELSFFIKEKDPEYFAAVIRPYLANKAEKTFLDHYLLGDDLLLYLRPWAFERLNLVERILLTRSLESRAAAGERHVRDLLELSPPSSDWIDQAFSAAITSDALADRDEFAKLKAEVADARPAPEPRRNAETGRFDEPVDKPRAPAEEAEAEEEIVEDANDDFDDTKDRSAQREKAVEELRRDIANKELEARKKVRRQYRAPEDTRRFLESNYWLRTRAQSGADMIRVNQFWLDFARSREGQPFFSPHFTQATGTFSEMMFALALLDLPFVAAKHEIEVEGKSLDLKAGSPLLVLREELRPAETRDESSPILVSQSFFRLDDPWVWVDGERRERYVSGEFLVGVAYGCRIVITNPTASPRKLELLMQVPEGSLPLKAGLETGKIGVTLSAYGTTTQEFHFYFPAEGSFRHYPAHLSRAGRMVGAATAATMTAVRELSEIDTTSWEYLSQSGSADQVLDHLRQANVLGTALERIAWRLRDRGFYDRALELIDGRHGYSDTLWSYAVFHHDPIRAREYLEHQDDFLARCGPAFESPLVTIDPVARLLYEQVDYAPLYNPRAHPFGKRRQILNSDLAAQFGQLMDILGHRKRLDSHDWMSVTCYLLLQDRIEEALASFARVDPTGLETRIQYDYLRAYLDFFSTDHALARGIAERYRDHPVLRWRNLFRNVLQQLDEAEGKAVAVVDDDDRDQTQTAAGEREASVEMKIEARRIRIEYRNLASCEIGFHEMDVEFLFSSSPFVQGNAGGAVHVRPNRSLTVALPADRNQIELDLPEDFRNSNLIVELKAGALRRQQTYFANSLTVQMIENFGQLRVTESGSEKALPRVYVKVYAREPGGRVRFHKDGYTDLRGRFDYASLSGPEGNTAEAYAVLILSEDRGAEIREVRAPGQ